MSFKHLLNNLLIWSKFHSRSFKKTFTLEIISKLTETEQTTKKNRTKITHTTIPQIHLLGQFTPYASSWYLRPLYAPTHTLIYTHTGTYVYTFGHRTVLGGEISLSINIRYIYNFLLNHFIMVLYPYILKCVFPKNRGLLLQATA